MPLSPDVYYGGQYWNDLPEVVAHLNRLATGSPTEDWISVFARQQPPGHALILNCGDGWVERKLLDRGVIRSAVAIDVLPELIEQARTAGGERPIEYRQADINAFAFPVAEFDCVINVAACHHTTAIDRTLRAVASALRPDGVLVSFDYVGPHRNQYPYDVWETVWRTNEALPPHVRADLRYPHLPTMLATDPTEAIHSELFLPTLARYFEPVVSQPLGGAIAYPILTHNPRIHALSPQERAAFLPELLATDERLSACSEEASLFAFLISRPRAEPPPDDLLEAWTAEEESRERAAVNGRYYDRTLIQELTDQIADLRDRLDATSRDA